MCVETWRDVWKKYDLEAMCWVESIKVAKLNKGREWEGIAEE